MALSPVPLRALMSAGFADTIAFTRSNSPALIASMKAAPLEALSGMLRFYTAGVILAITATVASAQPAAVEQPLLGSILTADRWRDLPTGDSIFAIPETIQLEAVSDLFSAGGLNVATAPKIGGLLNSWTQTQYRIGDVAITDPHRGGTPLLLPPLSLWSHVAIATGAMGVDDNAPGVSITLEPPRPSASWTRTIDGWLSAPPLVAVPSGAVPAVDRVDTWLNGAVSVSGPVTDRLGIVAAGSFRNLSHVPAPGSATTTDSVASGFSHLVFAATPRDELRGIAYVDRATTVARTDTGLHLQATWERRDPGGTSWRLFGGYTGRDRMAVLPVTLTVD